MIGSGNWRFLGGAAMDTELSPVREARAHHRHELRTLTYVTLDQANGGIVRNLSHDGIGVQVVAGVRPRQQLRVRFELRYPRLRVEARGEVTWATFSGQCGIRFLDLSPRTANQIDEWIFGNLLDGAALQADLEPAMFPLPGHAASRPGANPIPSVSTGSPLNARRMLELGQPGYRQGMGAHSPEESIGNQVREDDDGMLHSRSLGHTIELPTQDVLLSHSRADESFSDVPDFEAPDRLDWLSRTLSGSGLAWTINSLVVIAGLLLFTLIFLLVTRELPEWPVPMIAGAAMFVSAACWGFFKLCGGPSPGLRLARLAGHGVQGKEESGVRFR
jgi:hypothetical protein